MFCVEEHKWDYSTRIYIGTLIPRVYIGVLATHPHLGGGKRPHLGATRPRVGIAKLGFDAPTWQCRREDASPPSEDTSPKWGRVASVPIYIRVE